MPERLRRSRRARVLLALLAFVAAGSLSNALMTATCERATDRWLRDRLAASPTIWPGRRASSEPARFALPWIVAVDYECVLSHTGSEWGTRSYLALPGLPIPVRNLIREQS